MANPSPLSGATTGLTSQTTPASAGPSQATFLKWSTAQQDAYLENVFSKYTGTFDGMSAETYYRFLRSQEFSPLQALAKTYANFLASGTGSAIGQIVGATGSAVGDVSTGIQTATILPSWSTGLATLLGDLETPKIWLRIAEGILGILLIATAVSHMTGAGSVVGKAARALPLVT